jgi:hypothetical protein
VIWLDESFMLFPTSGRVYIWRTPKEAYNPECLVPPVKHGWGSVMVRTATPCYSILLVPLLPFMTELLQGSTWTDWVIRCITWSKHYFRTTMQCSKTINFNIYPGQHSRQIWTSLNHSGQFWRLRARNRFPPPTSLKQLEDVLQEEWYKIPLDCPKLVRVHSKKDCGWTGPTPY